MPTFKAFHKDIIREKKAAERSGSEYSKIDKGIKKEEKRKQNLIKTKDEINAKLRETSTTDTQKIKEYTNLLAATDLEIQNIDKAVAILVAIRSKKHKDKNDHIKTKEHVQFVRNNEEQIRNRKINAVHKGYRAYLEDVPTKARRAVTAALVSLGLFAGWSSFKGGDHKDRHETEISYDKYKNDHSKDFNHDNNETENKKNNTALYDTAKVAVTPDTIYVDEHGKLIQDPNLKYTEDLNKKKSENKKNNLDGGPEYTGPKIDNFEFYSAEDAWRLRNADSTLAMKNYNKGPKFFKYHEVKDEFKGVNSSFWRQRNIELGRDAYDTRMPLRPGERLEKLKFDNLVVSKFSVKDGLEYARLVIIKKGTLVIVDVNGRIVATGPCVNPWVVNHTICPPNTTPGSTYDNG
jgi:hypothetical protein